jgi:hypothetical protein
MKHEFFPFYRVLATAECLYRRVFLIALYRISHNRHADSTSSYILHAVSDRTMDGKTLKAAGRNASSRINRRFYVPEAPTTTRFVALQPHLRRIEHNLAHLDPRTIRSG